MAEEELVGPECDWCGEDPADNRNDLDVYSCGDYFLCEECLDKAYAAPELLKALKQAVMALNVAPRYAVGGTDSYEIASLCDRAINKAEGRAE